MKVECEIVVKMGEEILPCPGKEHTEKVKVTLEGNFDAVVELLLLLGKARQEASR